MVSVPLPSKSDYECRQRDCDFTKADLEELTRLLRAKYPDLLIYERSRDYTYTKIYRSLAEVDQTVQFCEKRPDWLREIEAREGPQSALKDFPIRQLENPMIRIMASKFAEKDLRKIDASDGRKPIDFVGRQLVGLKDVQGCHRRGDVAARRFFSGVFRLLARFMTNSFDIYNLETGAVIETVTGRLYWNGPDLIRMAREDPNFYAGIFFSEERGVWCGMKPVPKAKNPAKAR